jgi:hypothetical protein
MCNWIKDLSDSVFDFQRLVKPKIAELNFMRGEIISIEIVTDVKFKYLANKFDQLSGIDAWQIVEPEGIKGIASRIQWGLKPWNTFTIRYQRCTGRETEYNKRKKAMDSGDWLYPFYTIQAYIETRRIGKLISLAIAKTKDIFAMIEKKQCYEKPNSDDGNIFKIVSWSAMKLQNYDIKIYDRNIRQTELLAA